MYKGDSNKERPEGKDIELSIVFVHYKTPDLMRQCIQSIYKNEPSYTYEIIVVDNNSMDETVDMLKDDFPNVIVIANEDNRGFPKGVNQGIKRSSGNYVLLLNPDITVLEGSLDGLHDYMEKNQEVGVVGPKLLNPDGSLQPSCFSIYPSLKTVLYRRTFLGNFDAGQKHLKEFTMEEWDHKDEKDVAWLMGSSMYARRKAIKDVGLMDERFFMYMEDVDWCRRFWRKGWRVSYYPEVEMVHYYAKASANYKNVLTSFLNKQTRIHISSAIKFFLKYTNTDDSKEPKITFEKNKKES